MLALICDNRGFIKIPHLLEFGDAGFALGRIGQSQGVIHGGI